MDPLLFGMNSDVVGEVIGTIVVLSLFIERALAWVFGWRLVAEAINGKGFRAPISAGVSIATVWLYGFDAMAIIFQEEQATWVGYLITGSIVAGGSQGSMKLFQDFLGWKSDATKEYEERKKKEKAKEDQE